MSRVRIPGRFFFSRVNFLCWFLFRYPFHPRVTAVTRKRSRSFCQKCRWQVTAKEASTLRMWFWMKWHCKHVHGCMVYTDFASRRHQFNVAPCNNQTALSVHHFCGYYNTRNKDSTHSESRAIWAQWHCSRAEYTAIQKRSILLLLLLKMCSWCGYRDSYRRFKSAEY